MTSDLQRQIFESMDARTTEDLLEIWRANDHVEWSEEAFAIVGEILRNRGVEPPEQDEPIYEHNEEDEPIESTYGLTEEELQIIDDENPPDFYDPLEVLSLGRWLRIAAVASIVITLLLGLGLFPSYRTTARAYFGGVPGGEAIASFVALIILALTVAFQAAITYLPLRVLAHILRILMQMEFNSRKPGKAVE